jgi:antirestriction factor ArdC-like protein
MPSHTASIYETITARIVAALEAGVVPWQRPWRSVAHHNAVTARPYSGVNVLLLGLTALERGYESGGPHPRANTLTGGRRRLDPWSASRLRGSTQGRRPTPQVSMPGLDRHLRWRPCWLTPSGAGCLA